MDEPGQLFRHGVFERTGGLYLPSASYNQTRIRPVPLGLRRTVEYNRHFRLYHERQPGTLRKYARPVRSFRDTLSLIPVRARHAIRVLSSLK